MTTLEVRYQRLLKEVQENPNVLGLILVGSRGKGFENEYSDYDVVMVVQDSAVKELQQQYGEANLEEIDLKVYSLNDFRMYAGWESPESWDRYNYAHVKILVDKSDGELQSIIKDKGHIPEDKLSRFIDWWIDGYVNGVFRSVKCIRNGNTFGAHLEAVNSMLDLLTLVFAMNGRHRPFLGYVQKELEMYPLQYLLWSPSDFVQKIKYVLETADLKTQQELLRGIEQMGRETGHGHMFDGWEGKDKWAMTFQP